MAELPNSFFEHLCLKLGGTYISHKLLACGAHNEHYLLKMRNENNILQLVTRISCSKKLGALENEYRILNYVGSNFGPKVFLYDKSGELLPHDLIVEEFINGPLVERIFKQSMPDDFIFCMATWYQNLHKFVGEVPKNIEKNGKYNLIKAAKYHVLRRYENSRSYLDEQLISQGDSIIAIFIEVVHNFNHKFSDIESVTIVQGDPTKGNVFFWSPKDKAKCRIRVIDWEFARYDLPQFDLSFFMDTYDLNQAQQTKFLTAYGYPIDKESQLKLKIIWLCHILGILAWRMERLALLNEGELSAKQQSSTVEELEFGIRGGLNKSRNKIREIYSLID